MGLQYENIWDKGMTTLLVIWPVYFYSLLEEHYFLSESQSKSFQKYEKEIRTQKRKGRDESKAPSLHFKSGRTKVISFSSSRDEDRSSLTFPDEEEKRIRRAEGREGKKRRILTNISRFFPHFFSVSENLFSPPFFYCPHFSCVRCQQVFLLPLSFVLISPTFEGTFFSFYFSSPSCDDVSRDRRLLVHLGLCPRQGDGAGGEAGHKRSAGWIRFVWKFKEITLLFRFFIYVR